MNLSYLRSCLLMLITLCFTVQPVMANSNDSTKITVIYKYLDAKGILHLTNKPPTSSEQLLSARSYLVQPYHSTPELHLIKNNNYYDYAPLIEAVAHNTRLSPAQLHAVVQVESAYNAGEKAVKHYGNTIPLYQETQNYVKKVKKLFILNNFMTHQQIPP